MSPKLKRWLLLGTFGGAFVWFGMAFALDTYGKTRQPNGIYDALIVPGCRVTPSGKPSEALEGRVRKAVELYQKGVSGVIVFTGGVGTYPPAEGEVAAKFARSLGVPDSAIRIEAVSKTTLANAREAAALFPEPQKMRVLVVTDAYHVFRARRIFDRVFGETESVGSTYGLVSRIRGSLRECAALARFLILAPTE